MTTTNLRTYSNRFASMEEQPGGGWVVFNGITGEPVYLDPESEFPSARVFKTYGLARTVMCELTTRNMSIAR